MFINIQTKEIHHKLYLFKNKLSKIWIYIVKLQNYYEARQKNPTLFYLPGPSKNKFFLEAGTIFMLPHRDQYGREIYVFRIGKASFCYFTILIDMYDYNLRNLVKHNFKSVCLIVYIQFIFYGYSMRYYR